MKAKIVICCVITAAILTTPLPARAAEVGDGPLDIVFVVDCSGSMQRSDPEQASRELIGLFASAANPANVRIGIVGYSDKIVVSLPPTGMGTGDG
ncbi:MAG: VWA domain-containing protein, partial [Clostridiales Family XIII bacterium]|nr:VWA domain-containing protein [Clostridiales Family XIII bacterium]